MIQTLKYIRHSFHGKEQLGKIDKHMITQEIVSIYALSPYFIFYTVSITTNTSAEYLFVMEYW